MSSRYPASRNGESFTSEWADRSAAGSSAPPIRRLEVATQATPPPGEGGGLPRGGGAPPRGGRPGPADPQARGGDAGQRPQPDVLEPPPKLGDPGRLGAGQDPPVRGVEPDARRARRPRPVLP